MVLTLQTCFFHLHHHASLSFRLKLLNNIKLMLSKRWEPIDNLARDDNLTSTGRTGGADNLMSGDKYTTPFTLDPMPYWREAMALLQREDRHDVVAGETALTDYMKGLASFIISCRHYYSKTNTSIVAQALHKLSDITIPHCVEGLLMLYALLPTDYQGGVEGGDYDSLLPTFIPLWSGVNHNPDWDFVWLSVLYRCCKQSRSYDWKPLFPFLLTKLRDLLHLPSAIPSQGVRGHTFPRALPSHYTHFFLNVKDVTKECVCKLTKICYRIIGMDKGYTLSPTPL
ncbi:hypothetical protein EON63_02345, partial [archaeon]